MQIIRAVAISTRTENAIYCALTLQLNPKGFAQLRELLHLSTNNLLLPRNNLAEYSQIKRCGRAVSEGTV